jgi:predicted small lipoprotein YifL
LKKIFCGLICVWILFTLAGCGGKEEPSTLPIEATTSTQQQSTASLTTQTEEDSSTTVTQASGMTGSRLYNYLIHMNHSDIAAPKIINAIKEKDVDALEALMCRNIKENVNNLPEEIKKLMNAIDGEIINSSWKNVGNYDAKHGDDGAILQVLVDIYLTTTEGDFKLLLTWETANTFAKEEAGIRAVTLLIPHGSTLADIRATEGIGEWHD